MTRPDTEGVLFAPAVATSLSILSVAGDYLSYRRPKPLAACHRA